MNKPLFIWAPSVRCGSTLLQRLISSTKDVLVFGESYRLIKDLPFEIKKLESTIHNTRNLIAENIDERGYNRFRDGDFYFWSPNVMPDQQIELEAQHLTLSALQSEFDTMILNYEHCALSAGFKSWGVKTPEFIPQGLAYLLGRYPESKHMFIYRNLIDVVKSAKARSQDPKRPKMIYHLPSFCNNYETSLNQLFRTMYGVKYETLKDNIDLITENFGLGRADHGIFDHKYNIFGEWQPGQYIPPAELTDEEMEVVSKYV